MQNNLNTISSKARKKEVEVNAEVLVKNFLKNAQFYLFTEKDQAKAYLSLLTKETMALDSQTLETSYSLFSGTRVISENSLTQIKAYSICCIDIDPNLIKNCAIIKYVSLMYGGDQIKRGIINLSKNPEEMTPLELKEKLEEKPAFILFNEIIYYVGNDFIPRVVEQGFKNIPGAYNKQINLHLSPNYYTEDAIVECVKKGPSAYICPKDKQTIAIGRIQRAIQAYHGHYIWSENTKDASKSKLYYVYPHKLEIENIDLKKFKSALDVLLKVQFPEERHRQRITALELDKDKIYELIIRNGGCDRFFFPYKKDELREATPDDISSLSLGRPYPCSLITLDPKQALAQLESITYHKTYSKTDSILLNNAEVHEQIKRLDEKKWLEEQQEEEEDVGYDSPSWCNIT